jgi:diacylglycerol kinase (ATP)
MQGRRTHPDEVLAPSFDEEYLAYRSLTDWREPYRIPPIYLQNTKVYIGPEFPDTPLIVFINAKSGGKVGPQLATILFRSLGQSQVFDVTEHHPRDVLSALFKNLTEAEAKGDTEAKYIRETLRILVAGGDGTVTWVLGTILELGLDPRPPVAVMPLGTGNDFSFNFGWGTKFEWSWVKAHHLYHTLSRYKDAECRPMDVWKAEITAPDSSYFDSMPHSLVQNSSNPNLACANFWNYYSIGLDAEAAYEFHHLRETHPRLASGRVVNQAWYSVFSCTSGWFCGAKPISNKLKLRVRNTIGGGEWRDVDIPSSIRAVVLLNLQSYGGGRDIWGLAQTSTLEEKGFSDPIYDDGLIEVIGFHNGWHTAVVMGQITKKIHGKRLAQCQEVELELIATEGKIKGERGTVYMQVDGEPWPQSIPAKMSARRRPGGRVETTGAQGAGTPHEVEPLRVRISSRGQSQVLVNASDTLGTRYSKWVCERGLSMERNREIVLAGEGINTTNGGGRTMGF